MPHSPGKFITLEGGEGSGKTTQAKLLGQALEKRGHKVTLTREPGGSPGAEQIRTLLVEGGPGRWDAMTEALLLFAARRSHLRDTIIPALGRGDIVICDRFTDSTMAYQGIAGGLGRAVIEQLSKIALGDDSPKPDLTLIFDLPVETGLARAQNRGGKDNRFENMGIGFHQQLRNAFQEIARLAPERCVILDAQPTVETVAAQIDAIVAARLKL